MPESEVADHILRSCREGAVAYGRRLAVERQVDPDEGESVAMLALVRASRSFNPQRMRTTDAWSWVSFKIKRAFEDLVVRKHPEYGDTRKLKGMDLAGFTELPEDPADWVCGRKTIVFPEYRETPMVSRQGLRVVALQLGCAPTLVRAVLMESPPVDGVVRVGEAQASSRRDWHILPDAIPEIRIRVARRYHRLAELHRRRAAEAEKRAAAVLSEVKP